jgi:hypothetical protein
MAGTLMLHCGAERIARPALATLPTPAATATWKPVAHEALVAAIEAELGGRALAITRQEFAVRKDGAELFGVMDFAAVAEGLTLETGWALGIHTANDKSVALRLAVGMRVFVCDNLAFSGDIIALRRKHTSGLNLPVEIAGALDRYQEGTAVMRASVLRLQETPLTDPQAKAIVLDVLRQELVPVRLIKPVAERYFQAADPDVAPRTLWGLHNAFTRELKALRPAPAFQATTALGRFFGIGRTDRIAALLN